MTAKLGFGLGYDGSMTVRRMAELMRRAEDFGFDLGFFSETIELMRDSVTALAAFAHATSRLTLGCTQIVRLRTPIVMAQTLASLDELSNGRIILSPGAFTESHAARHGLPHLPPIETLREWMEAMRLVLSGEMASYQGRHVGFRDVQLPWKPLRSQIPLSDVAAGRLSLRRMVELCSARPAEILSLPAKGRIAIGQDADLVLVDPSAQYRIDATKLHYRVGWTPHEGKEVRGRVVSTFLRGQSVVRENVLVGAP